MNDVIVPIQPILNMDIMLAILSVSPPITATSIMATCHFLYHEGAKVILPRPVDLHGSEQTILSLLRFMLAEGFTRCSYVRNLTISNYQFSDLAAQRLVDLVTRMSNLVGLRLVGVEPLLNAFPYLIPAFASLRSVKALTVYQVGPSSCELIRTLQSELVVAGIFFDPTHGFQSHPSAVFSHPVHLLQRSASTLREVKCTFWSQAHANIGTLMSFPGIIFPNVRYLALHCNGVVPCLPPYIQAFPNLAYFKIEGSCFLHKYDSPHLLQNQGQANMALSGLTREPWKHLQAFTGTDRDLWALRLTLPIPRLYLATNSNLSAKLRLAEVLASARPIHVTIGFENQPFSGGVKDDFLAALRSDGALGLRSVEFTIELMAADVDGSFDVGQFWTSLVTIFSRWRLCDLNITIRDISVPEPPSTENAASGPPLVRGDLHAISSGRVSTMFDTSIEPGRSFFPSQNEYRTSASTLAERTLEDFDVCASVNRVAASIPTLKNAVVSVGRPSRLGGGVRTARLCKSATHANDTSGEDVDVLYEEVGESLERLLQRSGKVGWAGFSRVWSRVVGEWSSWENCQRQLLGF